MPTISPQKPTGPPKPKPIPDHDVWGSIDTLRMCVFGPSGSGKTTFAATFPGPILWLICSGGNKPGELRSINTPEYRKKITPRVLTDTGKFAEYTRDGKTFGTVVLDHVSGLADLVLKEILGIDEIPVQKTWGQAGQQQYGQQALKVKEMLRTLLNLPGNVVVIAQERTFGENDGSTDAIKPTVGPALSPSAAGWLMPACDYVVNTYKRPVMVRNTQKVAGQDVVTYSRGKGIEYALGIEPHDVIMRKFRVPKGQVLPECIVDPSYDKVMELLKGKS